MNSLEELLPLGILVAISIVGKILESRKNKRIQEEAARRQVSAPQASAPQVEEDVQEYYEEEVEESLPPSPPEPVRPSPMAPPVATIPEGLKTILRTLGVDVERPEPPPQPKAVEPPPVVVRPKLQVQMEKPQEVKKPVLNLNIESVRAGILWKTVLDEPRSRRPWRPI